MFLFFVKLCVYACYGHGYDGEKEEAWKRDDYWIDYGMVD